MSEQTSFGAMLNMLGLLGISLVLMVAFYYQLALGELPCPLCLLQRAGFVAIGIGFLFNLRIGEHASHHAMILAGSLVTGFISVRQVALHLGAGDPGYGSTLFGLHFYTWALIAAVGVVGYVALLFVLKDVVGKRGAFEDTPINGWHRNRHSRSSHWWSPQISYPPCWNVERGSAKITPFTI